MTIVRCPRCRDEVTAPVQASGQALVRCPLCLEEYLLSEAMAGVPPELIVVGGRAVDDEDTGEGEAEYQLSGNSFAPVFDSSAPKDAAVATARPSLIAAPRPKKQEKNAALELVKIVLGGVVGLAIGLVVLWWGFRRDPLDLGPTVSAYAPWLVPAQFHGKSKAAGSEAAAVPKQSRPARQPQADDSMANAPLDRLPASPEPAGFDSGLIDPAPSTNIVGKLPEPNLDIPHELPKRAAANLDLPTFDLTPTPTPPADDAAAARSAPPMPDLTDLLPDDAPPAELAPPGGRPVPSPSAFAKVVAAATEALAKYEGLPREDAEARREAFVNLHLAIGETGRVISYLNAGDAELSEDIARLQDLLDTISGAKGSSKINPVKFLTSQQWPNAKQDDGMLVAGMVKAIEPAGRLHVITLDAGARGDLMLPVLTTTNPEDLCAVGDVLVVVGRVLHEPQKHLPGYEGEHAQVLLLGQAVRGPKTE